MLEKIPAALGHALQHRRAGLEALLQADAAFSTVPETVRVSSDAFEHGGVIPARYTTDGDKSSPPLAWQSVPAQARSIVLVVEDADSPTTEPLVHAIVWGLPGTDGALPAGALRDAHGDADRHVMGRNSYLQPRWLPPDPPTGHGPHRYAFQVFALDIRPDLPETPGRATVRDAMRGHVLARGCLVGTYERV